MVGTDALTINLRSIEVPSTPISNVVFMSVLRPKFRVRGGEFTMSVHHGARAFGRPPVRGKSLETWALANRQTCSGRLSMSHRPPFSPLFCEMSLKAAFDPLRSV